MTAQYFEQFVGDVLEDAAPEPKVRKPRPEQSIASDSLLANTLRYVVHRARYSKTGDVAYLYGLIDPDKRSLNTLIRSGYLESGVTSFELWYRVTEKGRALYEQVK